MTATLLPGSSHFIVAEEPAYAASGAGEHLYVELEKEGLTTDQVAEALAKACGRRLMDVGYAGRKDRHAITRQWFSVHFGEEAQLTRLPGLLRGGRAEVRAVSRHRNKIRLGHLAGNRFTLGVAGIAADELQQRLDAIAHHGVRHRFGSQRFGVNGATLALAKAWGAQDWPAAVAIAVDPTGGWRFGDPLPEGWRSGPEGRVLGALRRRPDDARGALNATGDQLRKLAASAAQAAVFNAILEARDAAGLLHRLRVGDLALAANGAPFTVVEADLDDVNRRAAPGVLDARASAPLPGDNRLRPTPEIDAEERAWAAGTGVDWAWFARGAPLESPGERRPLVVPLRAPPVVRAEPDRVVVELALPPGCYATEVLAQAGVAIPADRAG